MTDGEMQNPTSGQTFVSDKSYTARRGLLWLALALVLLLGLALMLPSLVSIGRYQRTVTGVMARSLGRPVRLSQVEWRLLPSPAFVLHDLTVSENPDFGQEPILFARTVVASVDLLSLWGGHPVFSRISVDEASLNLVRSDQGRWNLETFLAGPAQKTLTGAAQGSAPVQLPYLEATNTRVNLKHGLRKSPFSIVNADLSFWQDGPRQWRIRLRGQPVRTDIDLSSEADAGTGELRMEGSLDAATQLRQMPLHLQLEWRDAQLGQLTRLILGTDSGWRGNLTADVEVSGTSDAAKTRARLRATAVHRAEFQPDSPLDLDSNCSFLYQHSINAFHNVTCDTQVADGHLLVKAELPGPGAEPEAEFQADKIPLQAALDLLRTVRNDFAPGVAARGQINGMLKFASPPNPPAAFKSAQARNAARSRPSIHAAAKMRPASSAALTGSLSIDHAELRGGGFDNPLTLPTLLFVPNLATGLGPDLGPDHPTELTARFALPHEPATKNPKSPKNPDAPPLSIRLAIDRAGYRAAITGSSTILRVRSLATALGLKPVPAADGFASGNADLDISAHGPWLPTLAPDSTPAQADLWSGQIQLRHARWLASYLARPVDLPQGLVSLNGTSATLKADLLYGSLHGTLNYAPPPNCAAEDCPRTLRIHFDQLDAAALQAALLGPSKQRDLFQSITDRMRTDAAQAIPSVPVTVDADSFTLASLTLHGLKASLHRDAGAAPGQLLLDSLDATALGGSLHASGTIDLGGTAPVYTLETLGHGLKPSLLGTLLGASWSGGPIDASAKITTIGASQAELVASAKGTLDFDWKQGSLGAASPAQHLDHWSGTAKVAGGKATLGRNDLLLGHRHASLAGSIALGGPARFTLDAPSRPSNPSPTRSAAP